MELIKTFKEFTYGEPVSNKLRAFARNTAIGILSVKESVSKTNNWIRFPYYHHVFNDEKKGFQRQLKYLKNFGEFISMDEVVKMLDGDLPVDGRYFCVSFDDGYRCCYTNMMEITASLNIPVIIYLPTDYIGLSENNEADIQMIKDNLPGNPKLLSFLSWEQCREMLAHKVSFGSHTKTHANLKKLSEEEIRQELRTSKLIIEKELNIPCDHFACPWGRVNISFDPQITTPVSKELGYKTFATTDRGKMQKGDDLFLIKRDHLLAQWGNFQLKYFFSK